MHSRGCVGKFKQKEKINKCTLFTRMASIILIFFEKSSSYRNSHQIYVGREHKKNFGKLRRKGRESVMGAAAWLRQSAAGGAAAAAAAAISISPSPAKKAESDFWRFSAPENQKIREKNPLTNTSNNKLGHGYLYFKPCSAKQRDEMTSCGSIATIELVLVPT